MSSSRSSSGRHVVFGQSQQRRGTSYQRQFGGARRDQATDGVTEAEAAAAALLRRQQQQQRQQALDREIDQAFGHGRLAPTGSHPQERRGWLYQMQPTTVSITFPVLCLY
jgi:hypothetical protein